MAGKDKRVKEKKIKTAADTSFLQKYWQYVLIALFGFAIYANSIPNDYAMDDELVTKNHRLTSQGIKAIPQIFTSTYYSDNMGYAYDYRPIVLSSFAIEHQFLGESPHVSHFINVLLYAILCVLLYVILKRTLLLPDIFLVTITLLFTAHPIHTEVVSSIKNRDELLAFIFGFASFINAIQFYKTGKYLPLIFVPLFFALSLLSKQTTSMMAILIPFTLVVFSSLSVKRLVITQILLIIPFFLLNSTPDAERKFLITGAFFLLPYLVVFVLNFSNPQKLGVLAYSKFQELTNLIWQRNSTVFSGKLPETRTNEVEFFDWKKLFLPYSFLPAVFLAGVAAYSFLLREKVLFFTFLILITVGYLMAKKERRWWWFLALGIAFIVGAYYQQLNFSQLTGLLFLHWCLFNVVRFSLWYSIPCIIFFVVNMILELHSVSSFNMEQFDFAWIVWGLALYVMRFRYGYIFSVAVLIVLLLTEKRIRFFSFTDFDQVLESLGLLALYLLPLYLLWRNKEISYLYKSVLILMVALFSFNQFSDFKYSDVRVPDPVTATQVNILPANIDRPIKSLEAPVDLQSSASLKWGTSFNVLARYLKLVIVPYPMSYYYGYSVIEATEFTAFISIISFILHALLGLAAILLFRKKPVISFGIIWYLVSIFAFTSVVQTLPGMMGDRYLFGASLGFCILLTCIVVYGFRINKFTSFKQIPAKPKYILFGVLVIYSFITIARNRDWKDYITLFESDIEHVDKSAQAHNLLALRYNQRASTMTDPALKRKEYEKGLFHFKRALEIYPPFLNVSFDIGRTYQLLQMPDSALPYFKRALEIDSTFLDTYNEIGDILFYQRKFNEAVPYFQHLINQRPQQYVGYDKLSFVYYSTGQYEKSIAVNKQAIQNVPMATDAYINIGRTFQAISRADSAHYYFEKAKLVNPSNFEVKALVEQLDTLR